jgi:molecular chaperone DnaK
MDKGTGKEQHITITAGSNMSESDIEKAIKEAAEFEAPDKKRKDVVDTRNDADSFVFQTEKALNEVGDKISADEKAGVEADIAAIKAILERNPADQEMSDADLDELKAAKEKLTNSAQSLFTKMYENMQKQGGDMGGMDGMDGMGGMGGMDEPSDYGPAPEGDVVDGDFREV